jgi:protein gp37
MSGYSTIEWTDATWNPVTGCTKVSEGCANCYAERLAKRFRGIKGHPLPGEFGAHVSTIQELIGTDPAFLFVDPNGWKGAAMTYIAPLR